MGLPSRNVRSAAVSGTFYPADKQILESVVNNFIAEDKNENIKGFDKVAKALIVPHAGFQYSGSVAAKRLLPAPKIQNFNYKGDFAGPRTQGGSKWDGDQ